VELHGPTDVSCDSIKVFLFHAAREMLFNIIKHAEVTEAVIRLRRRHGRLWLAVCDHGQGFDPKAPGQTGGSGLLSVRQRAALLGGRMKVRSAPGRGSTFLIVVPDAAASARVTGAKSVKGREASQAGAGQSAKPDKQEKGSRGDARGRKGGEKRAGKSPTSHKV